MDGEIVSWEKPGRRGPQRLLKGVYLIAKARQGLHMNCSLFSCFFLLFFNSLFSFFLHSSAALGASSARLCVQSLLTYPCKAKSALTYPCKSNPDQRESLTRTAPRSFDQGAVQLGAGDGLLSRALSSGVPSAL